ncbi:hypothetical protein Q7P36_010272 [Cladosporium allicinum]
MPPRKSLKRKASSELDEQQQGQQSQPAQQQQQDQTTVATIEHSDAEATFGPLFDGLQFDPHTLDQENLEEHRRRWQLRRDLAELSLRPEGFLFPWVTSTGRTVTAPLLTPPASQVIQREDGSWYRVPRMDGSPAPYSQAWYQEYLRTSGLPAYFLRPRHLAMLLDDDESVHLQRHNVPSARAAVPPPRDYLELRYPASPLWPAPAHSTYLLGELSEDRFASLIRHFPAIGVDTFPYNVFVFPGGNLGFYTLGEVHDLPTISEAEVNWVELDQGTMVPASYHRESIGPHPFSYVNQASAREMLIQSAINDHAVINPMEEIPGLGQVEFLSEGDRLEAQRRGYATAQDVSMARRRGELAVGTGINAGPVVIFRPDPEYLNPVEDPQGPGAWRFLTSDGETSNANFAAIQFGGSRGLPARPSARQIRQLGQLFIQEGRNNLAAQIDVVWVPGAEDVEDDVDLALNEADLEDEEGDEELIQPPRSPRHNPDGLIVDPTNNDGIPGGEHDQTGEWAEHQTMRRLGGRIVTIDRSRAWLNHPEDHKLWCYGHKGWTKWKKWQTMDWFKKEDVAKLNKHREQTHSYKRSKWPALRKEKRVDYRLVELKFAMEAVKAADGDRVKIMKELPAAFRRRFPLRTQSDTGFQSLVDRLRKELKKYGGLRPRKPRGWKQKQMSKAASGGGNAEKSKDRVESDESGEDDGGEGEDDGGEGEDGEDAEDAEDVEDEESEEDGDEAEA